MDVAARAWLALDREAVEEVSRQLEKLSRKSGPDFALPARVDMMAVLGTVIVGAEYLGFDIDRPGLHVEDELPSNIYGSNLALLLSSIERISADLPYHALGRPVIVECFRGDRPNEQLQFPPFDGAAGAVLARDMDLIAGGEYFCSFTPDDVTKLAHSIVDDMRLFWNNSRRLAPEIEQVLAIGNRTVGHLRDVNVHAAIVEYNGGRSSKGYAVSIESAGWEHCFRRGLMAQRYTPTAYPPAELDARTCCARRWTISPPGYLRRSSSASIARPSFGAT
ncbi:hypothetical protein [Sphingomonas yantingensis]|uniref:Uncharacterized protein n=1 Tax=Sphingomonas yantingensis TaxID=1241761 RepID=A0A7W9EI07_9SPHN|nr:hypothetical protein [Sphingomonas yantingensis]MBB5697141.1 hypothetical protein [Sphingomonas yantingensis]